MLFYKELLLRSRELEKDPFSQSSVELFVWEMHVLRQLHVLLVVRAPNLKPVSEGQPPHCPVQRKAAHPSHRLGASGRTLQCKVVPHSLLRSVGVAVLCGSRTLQVAQGRFPLDIRETTLTESVLKACSRLPRELAGPPIPKGV